MNEVNEPKAQLEAIPLDCRVGRLNPLSILKRRLQRLDALRQEHEHWRWMLAMTCRVQYQTSDGIRIENPNIARAKAARWEFNANKFFWMRKL